MPDRGLVMPATAPRETRGAGVHPVVAHLRPCISAADRQRVIHVAGRLLAEDSQLSITDGLWPGVRAGLRTAPTLHIHDTDRAMVGGGEFAREHRALLLARGGDVVAMSRPPARAFEDHCRDDLGLGGASVLWPASSGRPMPLALRCVNDPEVIARLSEAARVQGRLNVAPYIATGGVWALAAVIARESGARVHVAGPPPGLCRKVNNKIWFARQVSALLGSDALPVTTSARCWAVLAHRVRECAREHASVGVKLPSESGASGNLVIDSDVVRTLPSLRAVVSELRRLFRHLGWDHPFPMLVSVWEDSVLLSPSVQFWIPQRGEGEPIVEGVFDQRVEAKAGKFVGCAPSSLNQDFKERLAYEGMLVATLFQELGYFGRCSLDAILVGENLSKAELHWIECNGRWGGTSIPMTLANRLVGDWARRPFVVVGSVPGEPGSTFEQMREVARDQIYDPAAGTGLIFVAPPAAETGTGIDLMVMGRSLQGARRGASEAIDVLRSAKAEQPH